MCPPPSWTLQKSPLPLLQFDKEKNIPGNLTERIAYWLDLKIAKFSIPRHSSNRMMSTLIIVNITSTCVRDRLEDKYLLVHSKKTFLLPSVWPGIEYNWALVWKKSLLICFESYQGIPYSHTGIVERGRWTLC